MLSNLNKNNQNSPSPQKNQIIYQLIKLINHCSFICNYYWKSIDRSIDKLFESNECDIYLTKNYDNLRIMERKLNARVREFIMPNDNIWKFFFFFFLSGDQIDLNHPFTHTNHLKTSSEKMACQLGKRRRKRKKSSRVSIVMIVCVSNNWITVFGFGLFYFFFF